MNICGIICEYNPFHNGHLYQIEETKRLGADGIVCVMSGNFVQRGDFAIMPKRARAAAAVSCGADVVIELPLPWAISSAERFAFGAVSLLNSLGSVSHLSFGAECDDIALLKQTAEILNDESFSSEILAEYSGGISYAKARERALARRNKKLSELIKTPNNILAAEYLKALLKLNSAICPTAISRKGAKHDSTACADGFASATLLRKLIEEGGDISPFVPSDVLEYYNEEAAKGSSPVFTKSADRAIMSVLKRMTAEDYTRFGDVSEGLEFRLAEAAAKSTTLEAAISHAKTKRYAHARIRRIFLNAFLGVDSSLSAEKIPYARILAFNDRGREIIKISKKTSDIPIITRPSSIKNEDARLQRLLALERRVDDIYSLFMKEPIPQGSTFTQSPIYVTAKD